MDKDELADLKIRMAVLGARITASMYAHTLQSACVIEGTLNGDTERYRTLRAQAETARWIGEAIENGLPKFEAK